MTAPSTEPQNLKFIGVSAWDALHQVRDKLGVTTRYNPFTDAFDLIALSAAQSLPNNQVEFYGEPSTGTACRGPATIRVFFHVSDRDTGQENDTGTTGNAIAAPAYSVDVATGLSGALAGSVLPLWDDLAAVVEHGETSLTAGMITELNTRASQRAAAWLTKNAGLRNSIIYTGAVNCLPGPQLKLVLWRDYGLEYGGLLTEIATTTGLPGAASGEPDGHDDNFGPPQLSEHGPPNYPDRCQVVKLTSIVKADSSNDLYAGKVTRYISDAEGGSFEDYEECFIRFLDPSPSLTVNHRFVGRLMGLVTSSEAETRPLYLVRTGDGSGSGVVAITRFKLIGLLNPFDANEARWAAAAVPVEWDGTEYFSDPASTDAYMVQDFTFESWRTSFWSSKLPFGLCYTPPDGPTYTLTIQSADDGGVDDGPTLIGILDHPFVTGMEVTITGGTGTDLDGVNGTWTITKVDDDHFTLDDSVFAGTYDTNSAKVSIPVRNIIWMEMPAEELSIVLTEDYLAGGSSGTLKSWMRGIEPKGTGEGDATYEVWDPFAGATDYWEFLKTGDSVMATYKLEDDKYYISSGPPPLTCAEVEGTLDTDVDTTDATFTITVTRILGDANRLKDDDDLPIDVGGTLTIHNRANGGAYVFTGTEDSSLCFGRYDFTADQWDAVWVTCPEAA
ncbi:MAG: hypothetical protein U0836_17930 [Pirellulales bacterium]